MDKQQIAEKLKEIKIFEGMTDQDFLDLAEGFVVNRYDEGQKIITEGDTLNKDLYILISGLACTELKTEGAVDKAKINVIKPGQFFGEVALILDIPRSASVVATQPSEVLALSNQKFREIIKRNNHCGMEVFEAISILLAERICHTNDMLKHTILWGW